MSVSLFVSLGTGRMEGSISESGAGVWRADSAAAISDIGIAIS